MKPKSTSRPSRIEPLPFLATPREWLVFLAVIGCVFAFSLLHEYRIYQKLTDNRVYETGVSVINQYQKESKHGKPYWVFKFKSQEGFVFYSTSWEKLKPMRHRELRLKILTKDVSFLDFMRNFYAPVYGLRLEPTIESGFGKSLDYISWQHADRLHRELYHALFLGVPPSQDLRDVVSAYGISHLIAISGFHLGVLSVLVYALLYYPYRFFQQRFFPHRNRKTDLSCVVLILLLGYVVVLDFIPSLLRSYAMLLLGFLFWIRGVRILSFQSLLIAVLCLLGLFPKLLFSVGFWFSVSGVFYIFLFLARTENWSGIWQGSLINVFVFFCMMPITHLFFPEMGIAQLWSPLLTVLFILFYPLSLGLHVLGLGGLMDGITSQLFQAPPPEYALQTPIWFLIAFVVLSLGAIRSAKLFYPLGCVAVGFYIAGIAGIT